MNLLAQNYPHLQVTVDLIFLVTRDYGLIAPIFSLNYTYVIVLKLNRLLRKVVFVIPVKMKGKNSHNS
jgi:hypothetical protein